MKIATIFLVCLTAYAAGSPAKVSELDRTLMDTVSYYLGWTGQVGNYMTILNQFIQTKLQQGGELSVQFIAGSVSNALGLAQSYELVTAQDAQDIATTFGLAEGGNALDTIQLAKLTVAGDEQVANDFKKSLQITLKHHTQGASRVQVLRELGSALVGLLSYNAKESAISLFTLNNAFKVGNAIVDGVTHPVQAVNSVATFVRELQPKIAGYAQSAQASFANLQTALNNHASAVSKFSMDSLETLINSTINAAVACESFSDETGSRLFSTFARNGAAVPLTVEEVNAMVVSASDVQVMQFKVTVKELMELKNKGTMSFVLLGGLGASVLNLIADKAMIAAATIKPMLKLLGLSEVVMMLDAATQALADMQSQIPAAVVGYDQYCANMKDVVMEKVAAGGNMSTTLLGQALTGSLNYAVSNGLFTKEGAASLAASFGVNNGAQPLAGAASLEINAKTQTSADEFHASLAALLEQQANGGVGVSLTTLGAVNVAVMDLLAANSIVQASSLLGLKAFLLG